MLTLLYITWFLRTLRSTLLTTSWWQIKEYRWDRMKPFLMSPQSRGVFFGVYHWAVLLLLLAYVFSTASSNWLRVFPLLIGVVFLGESLQFLFEILSRNVRRPRPTPKALLIIVGTLIWEFLLIALLVWLPGKTFDPLSTAATLGILMLISHDLNALVVFAFAPVTLRLKRMLFEKARKKREGMKDLTVIGITGSYGKSSVKEFLAQLLETKYRVLKTAKNENSEIGIAKAIVNQLSEEHEIFVCEMGAYKKGEIALSCEIAQPTLAILTGINEQHIELFGSQEKIIEAKWELIDAIPLSGFAVFNGDSEAVRKRLDRYHGQKIVCSLHQGDMVPEKLHVEKDRVKFVLDGKALEAQLLGKASVINLMMAIGMARHLGVKWEDIGRTLRSIRAPEKTMQLLGTKKGFIIDDSYNTNTDGVRAALAHLSLFEGYKKVMVFPGILELGKASKAIHEELGEVIAKHCDVFIISSPERAPELYAGALKGGLTRKQIHKIFDPLRLRAFIRRFSKQKAVVLFESRGAEKAMKELLES